MRSKTFVSVVSLMGLGVIGTAQGASVGSGGTPPPMTTIPAPKVYTPWGPGEVPVESTNLCGNAPTLALCNSKSYQSCTPDKHAVCAPILQAAANAQAAGGTPSCHMDASHDHCIPDVTEKYASLYPLEAGTDWASLELYSSSWVHNSKAWGNPWTPANYSRENLASVATKKIDSCEAYVYAKYYDYERFLDASYACDSNDQCVVDVALTGPDAAPRLAGRVLKDHKGRPIEPHDVASESLDAQFMLDGGYDNLPKNSFYAAAAFMPPAVFDALKAAWSDNPAMVTKIDTLRAQLEQGYHYYNYGDAEGAAVEYHPTAWSWHTTMNNRTKPKAYAPAQILEFEDRRNRIESAIWDLGSLYACDQISLPCLTLPLEVARVTPGMAESRPADPFAIGSILTHNEPFSTALSGAFAAMLTPGQFPANGLNINLGNTGAPLAHVVHAKKAVQDPTTPTPTPTRPISTRPVTLRPVWTGFPAEYWTKIDFSGSDNLQMTSTNIQKLWATVLPTVAPHGTGATYPHLDCSGIDAKYEPARAASCKLSNVVLEEWSRSLAGNESCLDMKGYGCDWSPASFRKSVLGSPRMQSSRQLDYKECLKYTHDNFASTANAPIVQVQTNVQDDWKNVNGEIVKRKEASAEFKKKVPMVETPADMGITTTDNVYGDHVADLQQWGNDVFGAGYSYDIGWDAAVLGRDSGGTISRMQVDFNGDFEAHASAFGSNITLLETHLGARVNDNENNEVQARHYLYVIGVGTFDGLNVKSYQKVTDIAQSFQLADPHDKFSNNVFDAGFWCGPVYVHVGLDVEFFYDAPLTGAVVMPKKNTDGVPTVTPGSLISAELTFHPKAGVNADIYAYGGWGPIAEVGFEAKLNLITLGLPMKSSVGITATKDSHGYDQLNFTVQEGIDVTVDSLSGEVDVCGKIIGIGGCKKLISWKGLHTQFPLFKPLTETIALSTL